MKARPHVDRFADKLAKQVNLLIDEVDDDKRAEVYKAIAEMDKPAYYRDSLLAAIGSLANVGLSRGVMPTINCYVQEDVIHDYQRYEQSAMRKGSSYELLNALYVLAREMEWDLSDDSNRTYIKEILMSQ